MVEDAIWFTRGDVIGAGDARELVLGLGFAGLAAREDIDTGGRTDVPRLRPVLPVRVWPKAGLTAVGCAGRYSKNCQRYYHSKNWTSKRTLAEGNSRSDPMTLI